MTMLRLAVPLFLLAVLWQVADGQAALRRLAALHPGWMAAAVALLLAQTALSALRWRRVARGYGIGLSAGRALREYLLSQVLNQLLPGGIPGDAARAVRSREDAGLSASVQAVAAERALGQVALFALMLPALALSMAAGRIAWPPVALPLLSFAAVGAVLVVAALARTAAVRRAARTVAPQAAAVALQSAAIVGLNLMSFAAATRATGTTLTVEAAVSLVPLVLTAMLVPLSVGGWGWREGAAAALFPLAGLSAAQGFAASAAFGLCVLAAALPGALSALPWRAERSQLRHPCDRSPP
jgi:uncharacterized membrane protein YbhN (UPF0104 family)